MADSKHAMATAIATIHRPPRVKIVLGSSSSYRRQLLTEWGIGPFSTMNPDIDEYHVVPDGVDVKDRNRCDPHALTLAVATAKARHLIEVLTAEQKKKKTKPSNSKSGSESTTATATAKETADTGEDEEDEDVILICSDQVAVYGGQIREKPKSAAQVREWMAQYTDPHSVSASGTATTDSSGAASTVIAAPIQANHDSTATTAVGKTECGVICVTAVVVVRLSAPTQFYTGTIRAYQSYYPIPSSILEALIDNDRGTILSCGGGYIVTDPRIEPYLNIQTRIGTRDELIGFPRTLTLSLLHDAMK